LRLHLLRVDCDTGRTCPQIHLTDRNTYVIQGYVVDADDVAEHADVTVAPDERLVEFPRKLLPELQSHRASLRLTEHGTVLAWGPALTDPEALDALAVPAGEAAIELPFEALPALVNAHG